MKEKAAQKASEDRATREANNKKRNKKNKDTDAVKENDLHEPAVVTAEA